MLIRTVVAGTGTNFMPREFTIGSSLVGPAHPDAARMPGKTSERNDLFIPATLGYYSPNGK
jgi:hypothetical protein